jgi:hypothetical protein
MERRRTEMRDKADQRGQVKGRCLQFNFKIRLASGNVQEGTEARG